MPGTAAAGMPGLVAGYFLRTTAVLTLALIAAAVSRRRPAAVRHFLLSSALAGLLLLPFLSLAPVGWRSPLLPGWMAAAPAIPAGAPAGKVSGTALPPRAVAGPAAAADGAAPMTIERLPSPAGGRRPLGPAPTAGASRPAEGGTAPSRTPPTLAIVLAALWSAGLAVLFLRLTAGLAGAIKLTAEGRPLGGAAWRALLERFMAIVPLRRTVRLKSHPEVLVPLTWGWRRPVVLMPTDTEGWTDEERSSALFHELSHIKRADFAVMLLVRTSLAVFWWNPLCWVVYRELLKEQERACDELVLRAGIRPSSYAASLLSFRRAAGLRWNPSAALLGMLGRSSFQERLAAILKQKLTLTEVKMKTKIMLALGLMLAVALVGTARPVPGNGTNGAVTVLGEALAPATSAVAGQEVAAVAETAVAQQRRVEQEKAAAAEKAKAAEQAKETEKAKEAEKAAKAKAAGDKTIVIKPAGGEGKPIEIVITQGDAVKTMIVEKPLTITKGKDGGALVLTVEGKELDVLEGEPLRLEIKGGELEVIRSAKGVKLARTLGETGDLRIAKEIGKDGLAVYFVGRGEPKIVADKVRIVDKIKAEEAAAEANEVFTKLRKDVRPGEVWVQAAPAKEAEAVAVVKEGRPAVVWTVKEGDKPFAFASGIGSGEMLERIRALQEQVQAIKAKKMELSALEDSLKKLAAELEAKGEKLRTLKEKLEKAPDEAALVKELREKESAGKADVWVMTKDKAARAARASTFISVGDKGEGTINMVFTGHEGDAGKADFERAIAALKKGLPEGYEIEEQDFDAEKGVMTFRISGPEGQKTDQTLVKRLVELVQSEIKK